MLHVFFLWHSSDPRCSAWVEIAAVLISKDLFIVVFIPSPVEPVAVPRLSLFFISIFLSIHVQQGVTMSPSLLLTHRKSHTGLRYLLSAEDETLTLIICLLSHCFVVFGVPLPHPCPWLVFYRRILTFSCMPQQSLIRGRWGCFYVCVFTLYLVTMYVMFLLH